MSLPHIPSAIRALLLADSTFTALTGGRCTVKKAPPDVSSPYAVIQIPGNIPMDDRAWGMKPLVQVNGWCPNDWTTADPDLVTWDIAMAAINVLAHAQYVTYTDARGTVTYNARLTDGPLPAENTSRGEGAPIQGYLIRAELTLQRF